VSNVNIMDSSAILSYLQEESGQDVVEAAFEAGPSWVSAVNYCEILSKLREKGMAALDAHAALDDLGMTVTDFDAELARLAAEMRPRTIRIGASLGDRACLALAQQAVQTHAVPTVYTAERSWAKLTWPFKVVLIRR
jgi:ribonuclease VapC